jgi:hypothetical protein
MITPFPTAPWFGPDWELENLRRRAADLERELEKQRLKRRIEALERQAGYRLYPPYPPSILGQVLVPAPRKADDILPLLRKRTVR